MCTYNIHIDDSKLSALQMQFKDSRSVEKWIQQHIDLLVTQQVALANDKTKNKSSKPYRHEMLCGMLSTDASYEELRDEYVSEKYGV